MTENNRREETKKNPTILNPPDAPARKDHGPKRIPIYVFGLGIVLVALTLAVIFLPLGNRVTQLSDNQPPIESSQTSPLPPPPLDEAQPEKGVEELLNTWWQKQAQAEGENISVWGKEAYEAASFKATECDRLLRQRQHLAAHQNCTAAIAELNDLMSRKQEILINSIQSGETALIRGDADSAVLHFNIALAIDSNDDRAVAGAKRASKLPKVMQLLQEGNALEKDGNLDRAAKAYSEAVKIDSNFILAKEALTRVEGQRAEKRFQQAMSRALQAYSEKRLPVASKALEKAALIRPNHPDVSELRQQIEKDLLAHQLMVLRQDAVLHEQKERWTEALLACKKALSLDPNAAFALSCAEEATTRIELDKRLKRFLDNPERLFEDGPLDEAKNLLTQAKSQPVLGPRLTSQIKDLSSLIAEAETKVEVVIVSDNLTEVTIFHVGRLGRFLEKRLILRTGNYIATGSRDGYRDVRQTLKVRPSPAPVHFNLRCEEPI